MSELFHIVLPNTVRMSEVVYVDKSLSKSEKYKELAKQVAALIEPESDLIANLSNVVAALHETFGWLWTGFYFLRENELVLGPFQGPVACTRFGADKGVCGAAASRQEAVIVPDVNEFPGHIACSPLSRSEIVVPVVRDGKTIAVFDVDSSELNSFDEEDAEGLASIVSLLLQQHKSSW